MDNVLYQLNASTIFGIFNQIELEDQSRNVTTFRGYSGFKRLRFGVSSAAELYQHTIQQELEGCEGAYNIHDDIIIRGRFLEGLG